MVALLFFLLRLLFSPFRPISRLEAENAALRRQLMVLQRKVRGRIQFTNSDRVFFLQLYRWFPSIVEVMTTIRPETLVRWHRAGFRRYWRWKSWNLGGRPPIDADLRALIRRMSIDPRQQLLVHHPRDEGQNARPIHSSSTPADSQLLVQKIVASGTRRGYAENGQLTVFSTVLIF